MKKMRKIKSGTVAAWLLAASLLLDFFPAFAQAPASSSYYDDYYSNYEDLDSYATDPYAYKGDEPSRDERPVQPQPQPQPQILPQKRVENSPDNNTNGSKKSDYEAYYGEDSDNDQSYYPTYYDY